jgi:hypothetical protein
MYNVFINDKREKEKKEIVEKERKEKMYNMKRSNQDHNKENIVPELRSKYEKRIKNFVFEVNLSHFL